MWNGRMRGRLERRKKRRGRKEGRGEAVFMAAEGGGAGLPGRCVVTEAGVFVDAQNGKCKQHLAVLGMAPIQDRLGAQLRGRNLGTL